jgi:cholesterol transport system auxiliary component
MRWGLMRGCAVVLLAALAGCINVGGGGKPLGSLMTLTSDAQMAAGQGVSAKADEALLVLEPETDRTLAVARIAVQVDDTSIAYMQGAAWVERPARLFRTLLADTIRAGGKRLVLDDAQPHVKLRLSGRLVAMGYDARSRSVVVRYDAVKQGADGVIVTRRFESVAKGVAPLARDVAAAANGCANDVARQVADWVG